MYKVDLNSDLGESFGAYTIGSDDRVLALVSSANVACGFHAGQPVPDFIESARQAGADFAFTRTTAAARAAQIKSAAAVTQDPVHSGQQRRRVLQIGVHQHQIIAGRFPQSGEHRRLFAEVA